MDNQQTVITAAIGLNDGANKGFWRIQPRDRAGRWIEMGATVLAILRGKGNRRVGLTGNYAGPTGVPGKARVVVRNKKGMFDGVYEIDSHLLDSTVKAQLPESFLEEKGIPLESTDIFGNKRTLTDQDIPTIEDIEKTRTDITPNDERLIRGELTPEERAAEEEGRKNSPIAELPGGFESLDREEAKNLLRESGIDPDEFDKSMEDPADSAVKDVLADVAYGGDTDVDLDSLIDAARAPKSSSPTDGEDDGVPTPPPVKTQKAPANTTLKFGDEFKRGDVLFDSRGNEIGTVLDSAKQVRDSRGRPGFSYPIQKKDGSVTVEAIDRNEGLYVSKTKKKSSDIPAAPAPTAAPTSKAPTPTPTPTPTVDSTDSTAKKPATAPRPGTKSKPSPSKPKEAIKIPKGREDDGKDIPANISPLEQMQNVKIDQLIDPDTGRLVFGKRGKKIEDPNAIYNALLENNPQARVDKTDHIVLERGDFTDKDGSVYKYEVAVAKTHGNQYMERYRFTDSNGDTQTFYHFDYKDSFASIYGDKNGVYVFRDHILGRTSPEAPKRKNGEDNRVYKAYWADNKTLADRIRYYRGQRAEGTEVALEDLNKTSFKLLTPDEVVKKYLEGRAEKYNKSGQARGTKLQSFVGSAWEAIEQDDLPIFEARMVQLLGRLPDTEESRNLLINTLRAGIKSKFNGTPLGQKVAPLANNIERKILTESFDLRDILRRPFASKDGKTIVKKGDKVRYWNNVGEWSIGNVIDVRSADVDGYDDAVFVRFGDNQIGLLRSNRMDVLGDDLDNDLNLHDKDSEPTDYKRNVQGQELRDLRGFSFDFGDEARQDDENQDLEDDQVGSTADQDAAAPYLGSQGVSGQEQAEETALGNIQDFEAGDVWPDEDGDRLGTFVEAQIVTDPEDGTEAWAVVWLDDQGDEQLELVPIESSRVPK
jgi:hypothetical protein